jgi:hypothetical protein
MGASAGRGGGGGGRVSVVLTASDSFGNVSMWAYGGTDARPAALPDEYGAAGTVYRETQSDDAGHGVLTVSGTVHTKTNNWSTVYTELPAATNAPADELHHVTLRALTNCTIGLSSDLTMQDLFLERDDTILILNGYTLHLNEFYHPDWGASNRVVFGGGDIVWATPPAGTVIWVR